LLKRKIQYVVIPSTEDSPQTYINLMEALKSEALRDYLRVQMAECAGEIATECENNTSRSERVSFLAGKMKAYEFLLTEALNLTISRIEEKNVEETGVTLPTRFQSGIADDYSDV